MARQTVSLDDFLKMQGVDTEQKKEQKKEAYNLIKDNTPLTVRGQDELNEGTMNVFLETKYFPQLVKTGMISGFRKGDKIEDINGADYVLTFKDGSELKVDVKTRWSMMNKENSYVPVEVRTKYRDQIKAFEETGIDEDSPGWILDMDKNFETEHNKDTHAVLSIHPVRVDARTPSEATPDDIKDIKAIYFMPDEYFKAIERKTGLTSADINDLAVETNKKFEETGDRTSHKGLRNIDAFMYTSKGKLPEAPVVLLTGEELLRKQMRAFQTNFYTNDNPKENERPYRLTRYGTENDRLHQMALKVKEPNKETEKTECLSDMKKANNAPHFNSKDMIEPEQDKGIKTA